MFDQSCSRLAFVLRAMKRQALLGILLVVVGALVAGAAAPVLSAAGDAPQAVQLPRAAPPQEARHAGGEANLVLPNLGAVDFHGINGRTLLMAGLLVCVLGLAFGMTIFMQLRNLPVHRSMRDISELIYETCKTYLVTQGKFILLLE